MNITPKQIKSQYDRVKRDNWLPWFAEAAERASTTTAHFLAIGSRETNLRNIRGDFRNNRYNGFGVMQVDVGTDAEYAKNWKASDVEPSIRRGGEIYESKLDQVINGQGKSLTVKGKKFVGRKVQPDDARRIATSAYNCGLWAYFHFTNEAHIDSSTTGKDYSRDVYDRAIEFAALLESDGDAGALAREIQLQGKYASDEAKSRRKPLVTNSVKEDPKVEKPAASPQPQPDKPEIKSQEPEPPAAQQAPKPTVTPVEAPPTSITTKIVATASAIAPAIAATGLKIGGVEFKTGGLVAFAAVVIVGMVVAAWIWNQSQERRERRQRLSMENLASDSKGNVIAAGSKV